MTTLQYITHAIHGCCTTGELMAASKGNPALLLKLKQYAMEEMKNKGIEITENPASSKT